MKEAELAKKRARDRLHKAVFDVLLIVFVVALFSVVFAIVSDRAIYGSETRAALREARLIRLASDSVIDSFYSVGEKFSDSSSLSGLTSGAEEEVRNLSGCTCGFSILSVDSSTNKVTAFFYYGEKIAVFYNSYATEQWTLYDKQN